MSKLPIIYLEEHEEKTFNVSDDEALKRFRSLLFMDKPLELEGTPKEFMGEPKYLGVSTLNNKTLKAGYYIGVDWLKVNELAIYVKPKMDNIDFIQMFYEALQVNTTDENKSYFAKCYGINFNQPQIEIDTPINIITPLILLHYISLLESLTKRGLKKGYIYRQQNLQSKIKGHLLFQKNLRINTLKKRDDKCFCGFSEYTVDIAENRLLKKALLFTERASSIVFQEKKELYNDLRVKINQLKNFFVEVSDEIEIREVKNFTYNKLFAGYKDALNVAKMILRRYGYSINSIEEDNNKKTTPFWIDMPRLYEFYTYRCLKEVYGEQVKFQVKGRGKTAVDFILKDQQLILDAKYKPRYDNSDAGILSDIREMSGYARDKKILEELGNPQGDVPCVIIYPTDVETRLEENENDNEPENDYLHQDISRVHSILDYIGGSDKINKVEPFKNFYKLKIEVPTLNSSTGNKK